ncbi:TNFA factor, partial [Amia calva]|nr:TNFA factor [Amia calva]
MLKSDATAKAMKQIASTKRAAIHLIAGDKGVNEVQWLKEDDHSFFQGGLQLEENRVVIPRGGLYFVYTQASFKGKCQSTSHLSHNVILLPKAYGMEHSLLSAIRTVCRESVAPNADWYNALYQGAVFRLEAGDKLRTDTRSMKWLDESEGRTFFGVIEL